MGCMDKMKRAAKKEESKKKSGERALQKTELEKKGVQIKCNISKEDMNQLLSSANISCKCNPNLQLGDKVQC